MARTKQSEPPSSVDDVPGAAGAGVNRREMMTMMSAIAAVPALSIGAVPPALAAIPSHRGAWDHAMADWERLHAAALKAGKNFDRAAAAYERKMPKVSEIDASVWKQLPLRDRNHAVRYLDLDHEWEKFVAGEGRTWFARDPGARKVEYRKALDEIRAWRERDRQADQTTRCSAAAKACDVAWDAEGDAKARLMQMPAPDRSAALWKLEELFGPKQFAQEPDGGIPLWSAGYVGQFFNDVRRFLAA